MQVLKPEVKASILEASERLFYRDGFEGASMQSIAEAAGTSASNLYKYFAGKEGLFQALVGDYAARFARGYRQALSHGGDEEHDRGRIEGLARLIAGQISEAPRLFAILAGRSAGSPYEGYMAGLADELAGHVAARLGDDGASDILPRIAARGFFSALAEIAAAGRSPDWIDLQVGRTLRYVLGGLAAVER